MKFRTSHCIFIVQASQCHAVGHTLCRELGCEYICNTQYAPAGYRLAHSYYNSLLWPGYFYRSISTPYSPIAVA